MRGYIALVDAASARKIPILHLCSFPRTLVARLDLEVSVECTNMSSRALWGNDALLLNPNPSNRNPTGALCAVSDVSHERIACPTSVSLYFTQCSHTQRNWPLTSA
jgi:hypothetical protein